MMVAGWVIFGLLVLVIAIRFGVGEALMAFIDELVD